MLSVFRRPGGDLLFRVLRRSTMGAEAFNDRVRDGIGFRHPAIATRPAKDRSQNPEGQNPEFLVSGFWLLASGFSDNQLIGMGSDNESDKPFERLVPVSFAHCCSFHTRPINVVVFHGSQGRTCFEVGFPLRCLQRLSRPYIATQHCSWRHNCSTRGTSIPVLSY